MELVEKVQELQAIKPPLDIDEINRRIQEWKKSTGYKAPEAIEVKEVKIEDSPEKKDPIEESQSNTGSEALDSGSGGFRAGSKIFSNYLQTGIDPFSNESFKDIYQKVAGKDLNEVYNQFEYDKSTELEEIELTAERNPFNYNAVGEALGGAGLYADSSNIYEQLLQQELLSNLASDNNATTVNNLIDSGAISSLDQTSKRNKDENLYFNKSWFGKRIGGIFNNRFADINDIKETIRFKDAGPTIAMDYEGGVEFTYEQDIAGLNERLGGRKNENLRDTEKITQQLNRPQLKRKIKELERTGNEDLSGKIVYSSDVAKQLKDLYEILEDSGGEGFIPIDINETANYWLDGQVDTFINNLSDSEQASYQNTILQQGQNQLSEEEQNIRNAELKLRNKLYKTEEEKEELEDYLGSKEEFYGTRLLDDDGKLIDFDKAKTQSQVISEASELNETTDEQTLKTNLSRANRKVVELAKVQLELNQQRADAPMTGLVERGGRLKGSLTEGMKLLQDRNQLSESQLKMLNSIVETGLIPEDYRYISGGSRIDDSFNKALQEYEILNTSLQLNKNPLAVKNREYFNTLANAFSEQFQQYGIETPNLRNRKDGMSAFANVLTTNGYNEQDVNYFSKNMENNFFQSVIEGVTHLSFFAGELTIGRGLGASAGINRLARAGRVASKSFLKGRGLQKFYGVADDGFAAVVESAEFGGLTAIKNLTLDQDESISGSAGFGFAMKFGGNQFLRFTKNLNKRLLDTQLITPVALVRDKSSVAMFSRNIKSAFGGSSSFMIGSTITDPLGTYDRGLQDFFYNYAKEFTNMFFYGGMSRGLKTKGGSFKAAYDAIGNDFLGFSRFNRSAKKATSYFNLTAEEIKDPSLEIDNKISDAVDKKLVEINKQLEDGTITEDQAAKQIIETEQAQFAIENQITSNRVSDLIKQQRAEENYPSATEIYRAMQKYSQGIKFNDRDSQVFEFMSPEAILKELGGSYSKENIKFIEQLQDKELKIQRIMNGGASSIVLTSGASDYIPPSTYKVQRSNTKLRNEVYDFLNKKINLDLTLQRLQNQSTKDMAPLEKDALKKEIEILTKELESHMEGGEAAIKIQEKIDAAAATELSKQKRLDIQQETDAPLVTSKGEVTSEYLTNDKFVERLKQDGIEATPEDVAVTLSDGTIVYNESKMKNIKDFSTAAHEKAGHAIFFDTFKDAEGLVTEDGIKFINDMLNILPTSIREQVKAEVESRYDTSKPEKEWYEENLAVIAEFMKDGKIKYSESVGEQIRGVVPFFKRKGFDKLNIENPKDAFKLMQGLTEGLSEAQKSASKISVEQAGKRLTEQAVAETEAKDQPKKSRVVSEQAKELQDLLDNRSLVESLKSRSTEDKFSVAQAFVEKNFGLIKDLFNTRSQAEENALKEVLEEQILGEFPGSGNGKYSARNTNLFNAYDAAKEVGGAKETTYFRNVLSKRIPEIDIAIKERTGTSTELPDQTREFAPEPTTEKAKPTASKQLPSNVKMKPEFLENLGIEVKEGQTPEQAIQEALKTQVLDSFKDVDIKKYKDLKTPRALAEFYAKMLGIESEAGIKALMIPNRNFPAGEKAAATRAKQFILDNIQAIHSRINTPGFKQTKVGKALLTKKGDLKPGSLKILKDIISGENITVEGYDGKPIEFNPLENGKPVPLYRRSQPLKVVLASYFKNNALEYLKTDKSDRVKLGAKFKKVAPEITTGKEREELKYTQPSFVRDKIFEKSKKTGALKGYTIIDTKSSEYKAAVKDFKSFFEFYPEGKRYVEQSMTGGRDLTFRDIPNFESLFGKSNRENKATRFTYAASEMFLAGKVNKGLRDGSILRNNKFRLDEIENFYLKVQEFLKTKQGKGKYRIFEQFLRDSAKGQGHLNRFGAALVFYPINRLTGKAVSVKVKEEHMAPVNKIGLMLLEAAKRGTVKQEFKDIKAIYGQGALRYNDDKGLSVFLDKNLPPEYYDKVLNAVREGKLDFLPQGTASLVRYTIENTIDPFAYAFTKTQKSIGEFFVGKSKKVTTPFEILENSKVVNELITKVLTGEITRERAKKDYQELQKVVDPKAKSAVKMNELASSSFRFDKAVTNEAVVENLRVADAALELSRSLNIENGKPVPKKEKKIRVFDFDDTLARSNSKVLYTVENFEGGFSEGSTRLKAIFMVGGPGAGKTNVGKGLQLGRRGYKVVNQDIALEAMKEEAGLPAKESDYTAEQRSTRSKLGAAARKAAVSKFDKYTAAGDGMVIDGTGASYNATTKKIKALQDQGFEVHMVVATTPLETAMARNKARTERSLPDFVVKKTYESVQESLKKYRKDFGDRLYEINTETIEYGKALPKEFLEQVYAGINTNKVGKVNATNFAEQYDVLESQGANFDFREFSKVIEGKKGPLFDVAKTIADKRGTEDLFVLTARPQDAAGPIKEFMKALGIDIPLANITGLADGKASAKGRWIMGKVSEGYNDFYFADDALKNVQAVKEVLDQADVKSKVQQAKFSKAKTFSTITNEMIEASSGIETFKTFSAAKAKTLGENKGRFDWLTMASSAEDFKGLLYKMIGKGKQGEAHFQFLKTNLIDPYNRAEDSAIQAKISAANDFMALKSMYKTIPTTLKKETGVGKFTYQHALRTYMWTKQNMSIPGLSKADVAKLNKFVTDSAELQTFADQLIVSQKGKMYPEPGKNWLAGNLTTDIIGGINKINRAEYQKTFRENVDIIFSLNNLNKMEAAYGTRWRKALEDTLRRMKSGSNRPIGGSEITNKVLDWTNNSVGAVMFLNTRSALLQTISSVNFLNWGDNNPIAAGKAFANQKQFWGDFMKLMNSDYLVQRRNGLKINVSESEIADAVKDSKNKVNAAISYLLSKGFVFTRYADSFAIASGGSTFYRNRIKKYVKEGMDQKLAEEKAFEDFKDVAEESQQSSDASKISMQQASGAGRIILNWANTPMQYVRIQKRAAQDLIAGRGDAKEHISKIAYYGAIQNLIFNSLQQALFAIGFGSDEDEKDPKLKARNEQKITRVANGMIDSQLKGLGIAGAAMVSAKNTVLKIIEESGKKRPEYEKAAIEALSFSPAISSKYRKIVGGLKSFSWNMKEIKEKGFSLDNPAYLAGSQIFTAFTNVPLDRVVKKVNNIRGILSEQTAEWQKIALAAGYSTYDVGLPYYGGWDAKADPTPEEIKQRELDTMKKDTKTKDQIDMLLDLGLNKKEIKALGKEDNRVKKIIELQNKAKEKPTEVKTESTPETKPKPKPKTETAEQKLRRQFDSIKSENKPDQVKTLTKFGLTKKEIRDLRYEKNRVEKILELMDK